MEKLPLQNESSPQNQSDESIFAGKEGLSREIRINKELFDFLERGLSDAVMNGKVEGSEYTKVSLELQEIRKKLMEIGDRYR